MKMFRVPVALVPAHSPIEMVFPAKGFAVPWKNPAL
jgi:hypothetical protein